MFTIDLLKGEGVPVKSGPERIVVTVVTLTVPLFVALIMIGLYANNSIAMSIQNQQIASYQGMTEKLSDAVEFQQEFESRKNTINGSLAEVAASIGRHVQWSPILVTVARNMPESMVLNKLDVKLDSERRTVPMKDDPKKTVQVSVPVRTLQITVSGDSQRDHNKAVRDFKERLWASTVLRPKLKDIFMERKTDKDKDRDVVFWNIDCIFKSEL
ncbi:MAG: hypothetical protein ACYTBJ_08100 [Planctomycetota bacterium]|jgi:Tfp pilus assembly protein PilN